MNSTSPAPCAASSDALFDAGKPVHVENRHGATLVKFAFLSDALIAFSVLRMMVGTVARIRVSFAPADYVMELAANLGFSVEKQLNGDLLFRK